MPPEEVEEGIRQLIIAAQVDEVQRQADSKIYDRILDRKAKEEVSMDAIRLALPDDLDPSESHGMLTQFTEVTNRRIVAGEVECGIFQFRFQVLGEEEEFVVQFEVKVATQSFEPVKKSKWCHFLVSGGAGRVRRILTR